MLTTIERKILIARRIMTIASCIGIFIAAYLLITYITKGPIVCGPLHGCDVVRTSRWANWFGIPTPAFGLAFYSFVFILLVIRTTFPHRKRIWFYRLTMLAAFAGFIESVFLFFIQLVDIRAFCTWCLGSALMAVTMFIAAWWDKPDAIEGFPIMRMLRFQFITLGVLTVIGAPVIIYLTLPVPPAAPKQVIAATAIDQEAEQQTKRMLIRDGLTFEGPAAASTTVVEFIDFQCDACAATNPQIKKVREALNGSIRFAWRNFPLSMHPQSGDAAAAAICADEQGFLFPYGEVLLENQKNLYRQDLIRYAAELRLDLNVFVPCLDADATKERLDQDISDGKQLGVSSTPTIFVNATMIDGLPNAEQLTEFIKQSVGQ